MKKVNPFQAPGRWYKANLHTHTALSDGTQPLEERVRQYREAGYQILAITDHRLVSTAAALSGPDFLVIDGIETHPGCIPGGDKYHLVVLNAPTGLEFPDESSAAERIRMARAAGAEVIIGHPYWCGHQLPHLMPLQGAAAVEVFNTTCTKRGKGYSSVQWDDLLDSGWWLPAVAVDDTHADWDLFKGWTMFKLESLTPAAFLEALRTGSFYASCGPVIEDFSLSGDRAKVRLRSSPVTEIHLVAQRSCGRSFYAQPGETITEAEMELGPGVRYLRGEVVDREGRRAWTNPFWLV